VLETNIASTEMTADQYLLAGSDGLLPVTYYWRYRTWVPETDTYGAAWLPAASGQALTVDYGIPLVPSGLNVTPNPGPSGSFELTFTAGNAQGYDLEITGALSQNTQLLPDAYFICDQFTTRTVTLVGPDTYTWRVRGFNPVGDSAWSPGPDITVTAGTSCPKAGTPDYRSMRPADAARVNAPGGTASIAFQWDSVPGAAGYLVYVSSHSSAPILNYLDVGNVTRIDSINGAPIVLPAGSYLWCLVAYNCADPREYGGWNHSPLTPDDESPLFFEVIEDLSAPTIMGAGKGVAANTVDITWAGMAPATVDVLLFYIGAPGWLEALNRPVTATGANIGTVPLGAHAWGLGANYLVLTGKTPAGTAGPRSRLFVIP